VQFDVHRDAEHAATTCETVWRETAVIEFGDLDVRLMTFADELP
jgi:hypothetical protein